MDKMVEIKVINLDSRPDRWAEVCQELWRNGYTDFQRVSAVEGGDKGCMYSHLKCWEGEGALLVFEDDVIFEPCADAILEKAIPQLPPDFDLLYLGANVKAPAEKYSENLYRVTEGVHCTHAMLFSEAGRKIVNRYRDEIERGVLIDHWFYLYGLKLLKAFVVSPMIAYQRPSYSDVRKQWFDYRGEMDENFKNNCK